MIHVHCACGKSLKAPEAYAGKTAKCPNCKQPIKIPEIAKPQSADDLALDALASSSPAGRIVNPSYTEGPASPPAAPPPASRPTPSQPSRAAPRPDIFDLAPTARESPHPGPPAPLDKPTLPRPVRPAKTGGAPRVSGRGRGLLYLAFVLTLIPLAFSLLSEKDDVEQRLERTLSSQPQILAQIGTDDEQGERRIFELLPDGRIEGAHLARHSWMHWLYAALAAVLFFVCMLVLFNMGNATLRGLLAIGISTATAGIIFLVSVQFIAEITQGWIIYGRSIVVVVFYIVKFIGFSYRAALDADTGFWVSFLGFTCGVGFCEELTKALPLVFHFRSRGTLDGRGACAWGLAAGIGFGVAEGIIYSSGMYNGIATWDAYLVRFISCVALHAMWAASAGIMVWRRRAWLESDWDWGDMLATLVWVLGIPMILHGLYDTLLKKDMDGWALVVALASFAWLVLLTEWSRSDEPAFDAS